MKPETKTTGRCPHCHIPMDDHYLLDLPNGEPGWIAMCPSFKPQK